MVPIGVQAALQSGIILEQGVFERRFYHADIAFLRHLKCGRAIKSPRDQGANIPLTYIRGMTAAKF